MAELFDTTRVNVTQHINNILNDGELSKDSVCKDFLHTASDGKNYHTKYYNLDMIIAVGYRVNSKRATQFRQWSTTVLRNFALHGYVLDRKRMENGSFLCQDYFEHLLKGHQYKYYSLRLAQKTIYFVLLPSYRLRLTTINQ